MYYIDNLDNMCIVPKSIRAPSTFSPYNIAFVWYVHWADRGIDRNTYINVFIYRPSANS